MKDNYAEKKRAATESRLTEQRKLDESEMNEVLETPIDSQIDPSFRDLQTSNKSLFTGSTDESSDKEFL